MKDKDNSVVTNSSRKLLSIVMTGRDDDYMLDFKYRITTTINHIACNLKHIDRLDEVEVVVVDWGSEVPLSHSLLLTDEAVEICRFIYVPIAIVKAVQNGTIVFHNTKAINTGIRRSKGQFVMLSAADTLIPKYSMEAILRLLNGELDLPIQVDQTYFLCNRFHAPWTFVEGQSDLDEWDRFLVLASASKPDADTYTLFFGTDCGASIMHVALWDRLRGVNERIAGWGGTDFELMMRVSQYYPWVDLSRIGVTLCHMQHSPYGRRSNIQSIAENLDVSLRISDTICVNGENWGLSDYELDIQTSQHQAACASDLIGSPASMRVHISNRPIDRILSEMKADNVRQHVRRTMLLAAKASAVVTPGEVASIYFISWYALNCFPRNYMEFGNGLSYSTAAATLANKGLEVYYVDHFVGSSVNVGPCVPQNQFRRVGYRGYARYINGDQTTAVKRLRESFIGEFAFDLMMVRGDVFGEDSISHLEELVPLMKSGGALVYSRSRLYDFRDDWSRTQHLFPHLRYIEGKSAPTGIILNCPLQDGEPDSSEGSPCSIIVDLGPMKVNARWLLYRWIFKLLASPSKYPNYLRQILNTERTLYSK